MSPLAPAQYSMGKPFEIVTGVPCVADDNFCRERVCCLDGGCRKFRIACQFYCLSFALNEGGFQIIKGIPCKDNDNFCRAYCCFVDSGCRELQPRCQVLCLRCGK